VKRDIKDEYRYIRALRFAGNKLSTKLRDMLVSIEIRYFVASWGGCRLWTVDCRLGAVG